MALILGSPLIRRNMVFDYFTLKQFNYFHEIKLPICDIEYFIFNYCLLTGTSVNDQVVRLKKLIAGYKCNYIMTTLVTIILYVAYWR